MRKHPPKIISECATECDWNCQWKVDEDVGRFGQFTVVGVGEGNSGKSVEEGGECSTCGEWRTSFNGWSSDGQSGNEWFDD